MKYKPEDLALPGHICPACSGSGRLPEAAYKDRQISSTAEARRYAALKLREAGYSVRQIMRAFGLTSPASVEWMLKQEPKQ